MSGQEFQTGQPKSNTHIWSACISEVATSGTCWRALKLNYNYPVPRYMLNSLKLVSSS
jgi:hypothetical protein